MPRPSTRRFTKSTVPPAVAARKRAFRVALAARDMTAVEFAALQGVSKQALSQAINGKSTAAGLLAAVDRFIETTSRRRGAA